MSCATANSEAMREGGSVALTVVVPFTRPWAVTAFFDSLDASGIDQESSALICYIDHDDARLVAAVRARMLAGAWRSLLLHTSGWEPPGEFTNAKRRRRRHCAMRLALRGLLPKTGLLLLTEDDAIWPAGGYTMLHDSYAAGGAEVVTGWQVNRWGDVRPPGIWHIEPGPPRRLQAMLPTEDRNAEYVDACGLYAMLTTAEVYRALDFRVWDDSLGQDVSVTWAATQRGVRIAVDWRCGLGHKLHDKVIEPRCAAPFERSADVVTIQTPSGPFWAFETKEADKVDRTGIYRTKQRITDPITGQVIVGKGADIKLAEAVEFARRGLLSDPAVNRHVHEGKVMPGVETKPVPGVEAPVLAQIEAPVAEAVETPEGPPYACRVCGREYKTIKGRDSHEEAKH